MIRQIVEAGILSVFGLWSIWDGYRLMADARSVSSFDALGPDRYMMVLGAVLVLSSALYFRAARAEAAVARPAAGAASDDNLDLRRLCLVALAFAGYILLAPLGGYVGTTAIFFFAAYWIMDLEGLVRRAVAAAITTAAFAIVFIVLADIPMPLGLLGSLF
jgi:hypothetical protein